MISPHEADASGTLAAEVIWLNILNFYDVRQRTLTSMSVDVRPRLSRAAVRL